MAIYAAPGTDGSVVSFKPRYDHYIGGVEGLLDVLGGTAGDLAEDLAVHR